MIWRRLVGLVGVLFAVRGVRCRDEGFPSTRGWEGRRRAPAFWNGLSTTFLRRAGTYLKGTWKGTVDPPGDEAQSVPAITATTEFELVG